MIWETWVRSLGWEDPLEKGKATHSVFWPGDCLRQSMESQRVRRDWETSFLPSFHPLGLLSGYLDLQWLSLTPQEDTVSGEETEEEWGKEPKGTEKPGPSQWHRLRTQVQHDFFLSYLPSSFFFFTYKGLSSLFLTYKPKNMDYDLPQGGYLWFQDTEQLLAVFSFSFHYWDF